MLLITGEMRTSCVVQGGGSTGTGTGTGTDGPLCLILLLSV